MRLILIGAALFAANFSTAEDVSCAQIENARERLACYDQQFPRGSTAPVPKIRTEVISAPEALGRKPTLQEPATSSAPVSTANDGPKPAARPGRVQASPDRKSSGGILDWQDDVEIVATVKSVRSRDKQRMVFLLDNDQMWMQSSPRTVPIKEGDEVTIKSATMGGYIMRNQNDTTTRVQRIN